MKKFFTVFLLFSVIYYSQEKIDFEFDYAQFRYDSLSNYLEVYYSIFPSDFNLILQNDSLFVNGTMHIEFQNIENNKVEISKDWDLTQEIKDSSAHKSALPLLGVIGFKLTSGEYNLIISVRDNSDKEKFKSYKESILVKPFLKYKCEISDIQLATRILNENVNTQSIFYKNTFEVYPNPSTIFSHNSPVIFFYSELYGLNTTNRDTLFLIKTLTNNMGINVYEKSKKLTSMNESLVEVGVVNITKHPTGSYKFGIALKDKQGIQISGSEKKLFIINKNVERKINVNNQITDYVSSEFGVLSEEECDDLFEKSKIIASGNEIDQYEVLDSLNSKREFLFEFWQKRDDVKETPVNEFKNTFLLRIEIANQRYKTISTPGFRTDRGRVYARLGEPDEIERYPNETNTKPYEIWYYNQIEGGVYFVFGDYSGFNYYELLHSTMRGELQDPQWMRRIRTN